METADLNDQHTGYGEQAFVPTNKMPETGKATQEAETAIRWKGCDMEQTVPLCGNRACDYRREFLRFLLSKEGHLAIYIVSRHWDT